MRFIFLMSLLFTQITFAQVKDVEVYPQDRIRTLMSKYDCNLEVTKDIIIQRGNDLVRLGKVKMVLWEADNINKRIIRKGRKIKLNQIFDIEFGHEESSIAGRKYFSSLLITLDNTVVAFSDLDFYENAIPDFKVNELIIRSDGLLKVNCQTHQAKDA